MMLLLGKIIAGLLIGATLFSAGAAIRLIYVLEQDIDED